MSLQAPYVCPRCKQETRDKVYFPYSCEHEGYCCSDEPGVGLCRTCANQFHSSIDRPNVDFGGGAVFRARVGVQSVLYCNYCQGQVCLGGKLFSEAALFKPKPSAEFFEEAGQDFCKLLGVSLYWAQDHPGHLGCGGAYHESFVSKGRQAVRDALLPQLDKCKKEIKVKDAELQSLMAENKKLLVIVNAKEAEKQSLFLKLDERKREQNTVAFEKEARLEFLRGRRESFAAIETKEAELQGLRKELAKAQDKNKAKDKELQSLRKEHEEIQGLHTELEEKEEELTGKIAFLEKEKNSLTVLTTELKVLRAKRAEQVKRLRSDKEKLLAELQSLRDEQEKEEEYQDFWFREAQEHQTKKTELTNKITFLEKEKNSLTVLTTELKVLRAKRAEQVQSLRRDKEELVAALETKDAELQSVSKKLACSRAAAAQHDIEAEAKEAELQGLRKELAEAQDNKAELQHLREEKWLAEQKANSNEQTRKRKRKFQNKFNKKLKK